MSFSTALEQRNAITQRNRKGIGFKGAKLLVQQYFPETEAAGNNDEHTVGSENIVQHLTRSKAYDFHRKIQKEEEERNRHSRLAIASAENDAMMDWINGLGEDRGLGKEWNGHNENDAINKFSHLVRNGKEESLHFEKIDSSGLSIYD
jgi:hypothetical protein